MRKKRVANPFRTPRALGVILLLLPPVLALTTVFMAKLPQAGGLIVLASFGIAATNATAEQVLFWSPMSTNTRRPARSQQGQAQET